MSPPGCGNGGAGYPAAPSSSSRHQAAEHPDDTAPCRLDEDPDVLRVASDAVHRLARVARRLHGGPLPVVGGREWFAATWIIQSATILAEAFLRDPDQIAADHKAAAVAISLAADWAAASRRPSHAALAARRAQPGPLARTVDPAAAARWAATGSSLVAPA